VQRGRSLQWFFTVAARTFWLSFHAPYACRHSGACCSSGWDIPIETWRVAAVSSAIASGRLKAAVRWLRRAEDAPREFAGVLALNDRDCVFHGDSRCAIHTTLGAAAIPSACQHFPRIVLLDQRGVFVTLSHYCPTAASLLFEHTERVTIVEGPPALPGGDSPEGLDARDALPPLETPRLLMDWSHYDAWERHAVATLTSGRSPEFALDLLSPSLPHVTDHMLREVARASLPAGYVWPPFSEGPAKEWRESADVVGRYLSAHVFASWMAYQGNGLVSTVLYLRVVLAVLKSEVARCRSLLEAIRQSDLLLRHLVDRQVLADRLARLAAA
jgi:hypothetical protein